MTDAIAENKQNLNERVEEIRANRDLNDGAKQRMISQAAEEASQRHSELVAEQREAQAREIAELERSLFSLSYPKEAVTNRDREAYRQSYRDAAFKVLDMAPDNLQRVLDRAERIGDGQLAQAVYHEAVERGLVSLADRYRDERPDAKQRWERYVSARRGTETVEGMLSSALEGQAPEIG